MSTTFGQVLYRVMDEEDGREPTKEEILSALEIYQEHYCFDMLFYLGLEDINGKVAVSPIFCTLSHSYRMSSYMYEIAEEYGFGPSFSGFSGLYGTMAYGMYFYLLDDAYIGEDMPLTEEEERYFHFRPTSQRLCLRHIDRNCATLHPREYMRLLFDTSNYTQFRPCFVEIDSTFNKFCVIRPEEKQSVEVSQNSGKKKKLKRQEVEGTKHMGLFDVLKSHLLKYRNYNWEMA